MSVPRWDRSSFIYFLIPFTPLNADKEKVAKKFLNEFPSIHRTISGWDLVNNLVAEETHTY